MIPRTALSLIPKKVYLLLFFTGIAFGGWAQSKVWSLEDCIATAKANNLQVQRQNLQVGAAKTDLKLAKAANLPNLSGWYTHNLSSGKTVNFEDYTYINTQYQDGNLGIRGRLPLFQGLQGWNMIQQGKLSLQSAEQQAEAMETQITLQVVTAYLQILLSEEMLRIAEDKLKVSQEQIIQTEEFFKTGRVAKSEVLVIKSQEAQDNLDLITRQGDLELAKLIMVQILNVEGLTDIAVEKPGDQNLLGGMLPAADDIYTFAESNQPRIKAAMSNVMANEAALKIARGATRPSLGLNGVWYSRYSELGVNPLDPNALYPYSEQLLDNSYMRADISLNIPIFMKYSNGNQRAISQAKLNVFDSRLILQQEKKAMREEIQQASSQANTALAKLNASEKAVSSAKEAYDIIKEQFDAGIVTAIDLRISSNQLLQATAMNLQARYELALRTKILEVYQGKRVEL